MDPFLETVQQLPDDAELEEISGEIEFLAAVRKVSKQIAEGKINSHEQVKEQLRSWLTESSGSK
jgi:hypothetical protein